MRTLGIIGQGNFGKFIVQELDGLLKIETYDISDSNAQFLRVAKSDYIVLAIPLASYEDVLGQLVKTISPQTVIVDVCAVKLKPLELIALYLPKNEVLALHPLFGAVNAPNGIEGQRMIIIRDTGSFELHAEALRFFERLKLEVTQMDAQSHDKMMGELQAVSYFIAESLADFGVTKRPISIPSYDCLVALVNLAGTQSKDVIETVEQGNPYAAEMRTKLMQSLKKVNQRFTDIGQIDDDLITKAE